MTTSAPPLADSLRGAPDARARRALLRQVPAGTDPVPALLVAGRALRRSAPAEAWMLATSALAIARLRRDASARVGSLRLLGQVALLGGRPLAAHRLLAGACGLAAPAARAEMAPELATCLSILGRDEDARTALASARAGLSLRGFAKIRGLLEMAEGNILERLDLHEEALLSLNAARPRFVRSKHRNMVPLVDLNRANILANLGRYEQADRVFRRAFRAHKAMGSAPAALQVAYNHAYLEYLRGRFHEALERFRDVRVQFEAAGNASHVALCDLDCAEIHLRLNVPDAAASAARRAEEVFDRLGMAQEAARARFFVAAAARRRSALVEARAALEHAADDFRRLGCAAWEAVCLHRLAEMDRADGQLERAAGRADTSSTRLFELGMLERAGRAEVLLAAIELDRGDASSAVRRLEALGARISELHAPWLRCEAAHGLARALDAAGRPRAAAGQALRAVALLERHRMSAPPDEYMAAFLRGKAAVFEDAIRLVLKLGGRRAAALAFTLTEASKARALLDLLRAGPGDDRGRGTKRARETEMLAREIDGLTGRLPKTDGGVRGPGVRRDDDSLRRREERLRACVDRPGGRGSDGPTAQDDAIDVEEISAALPADTTLLEYHLGERELVTFVVTADTLRVVRRDVRREDVVRLVARMRFHVDRSDLTTELLGEDGVRAQSDAANLVLAELSELLLGPVAPLLTTRRIVVVPHGELHGVPFPALSADGAPLLLAHEVALAPSASIFARSTGRPGPVGAGVLVLGVPDDEAPLIAEEVRLVASHHARARSFLGDAATREELSRRGRRARVVHVATHAVYRADDPMASALRLGDGWLTTDQIYGLRLGADVVVLSGCGTGRATVTEGDDPLGLVRGFLRAGAGSLVTSLWRVSDASALVFMERFHRRIAGGTSPAAAHREAALAVRERFPHPHHWAAFVLTSGGDRSSFDAFKVATVGRVSKNRDIESRHAPRTIVTGAA